jgi:hypothetical protein
MWDDSRQHPTIATLPAPPPGRASRLIGAPMRTLAPLLLAGLCWLPAAAQFSFKPSGVKWEEKYLFDRCNNFKLEFYVARTELKKTVLFSTYYQTAGEAFCVRSDVGNKGNGLDTIIDRKNTVAIQRFGLGPGAGARYNAGAYKMPVGADLKQLALVATAETRDILGFPCTKYTYTHKKIFGEVWITTQVALANDLGVFRACKMAALHNTLSVPGFVLEMTTEDDGGGRTLMTTTALQVEEKHSLNLAKVDMSTAFNAVNYYTF